MASTVTAQRATGKRKTSCSDHSLQHSSILSARVSHPARLKTQHVANPIKRRRTYPPNSARQRQRDALEKMENTACFVDNRAVLKQYHELLARDPLPPHHPLYGNPSKPLECLGLFLKNEEDELLLYEQRQQQKTLLENMQRSVFFDERFEAVISYFELLSTNPLPPDHPLFDEPPIPLQCLGLFLKKDEDEDDQDQLYERKSHVSAASTEQCCSTSGRNGLDEDQICSASESVDLFAHNIFGNSQEYASTPLVAYSANSTAVRGDKQIASTSKLYDKEIHETSKLYDHLMQSLCNISIPTVLANDNDDEEWLFGGKSSNKVLNKINADSSDVGKHVSVSKDATCSSMVSSQWPPRAQYLQEAGIYALPYTLPF